MSTSQSLKIFTALHQQSEILLLGNVWDAYTARLAEKAGYKALGTSSHAIAFTMGYADGEEISFLELLFVVERIIKAVKIPVSVDFEAGYSEDPKIVASYVKQLSDVGAVGINLEDGIVKNGKRTLGESQLLAEKIKAIKKETDIFINARADTYTTKQPNALEESISRGLHYKEAGADGIFIPLIETEDDIKSFLKQVDLPLNVFTTPNLPAYDSLGKIGVKRISHGAKQYEHLMQLSEGIYSDFIKSKSYQVILGK